MTAKQPPAPPARWRYVLTVFVVGIWLVKLVLDLSAPRVSTATVVLDLVLVALTLVQLSALLIQRSQSRAKVNTQPP